MKRVYHRFETWEDLGMWYSLPKPQEDVLLLEAVEFTGNAELYGGYMIRVVNEWPIACENNLTAPGNKQAWLGHAACWMAIGCPEHVTRKAWGLLTDIQRIEANKKADHAIGIWEASYAEKNQ
jgi:hypothetical protein